MAVALEEEHVVGELTRALAAVERTPRAPPRAKARESAAAVWRTRRRGRTRTVLVAQRALEEAMALVDGARNEAAEAAQASEASLFEMSERLAAAEDARRRAEARAFPSGTAAAACPARFCPNGNSGGPADEIDAALTHVLHAAALRAVWPWNASPRAGSGSARPLAGGTQTSRPWSNYFAQAPPTPAAPAPTRRHPQSAGSQQQQQQPQPQQQEQASADEPPLPLPRQRLLPAGKPRRVQFVLSRALAS